MNAAEIEAIGLKPEDIRMVLNMRPDFRLADILAAFGEAIEHRHAAIRACGDCTRKRERREGMCERHDADADQAMTYRFLRDSFERAPEDPDEFATIARAVLRGDKPTPTERMIAAVDWPPAAEAPEPAEPSGNAGCIYVVEFSNGTVKVGRSSEPDKRLAAHRSQGRKFGADITDQWVSPQHAEWRQNESRLIDIAKNLGGTTAAGAEYFTGIAFADVVTRAQELQFTQSPAAA